MCINLETSVATFLIGSTINVYLLIKLFPKISGKNALHAFIFILVWQYALLMQIPDSIAWYNIKNNKPTDNAGRLAFILNVSQPIIFFFGVLFLIVKLKKNIVYIIPALVVCIVYMYDIYINLTNNQLSYSINPVNNCFSLNYIWWFKLNASYYITAMILICIATADMKWSLLNILIYVSSLVVIKMLLTNCNIGSMWCWIVSFAGLANYLLYMK